MGKVLCWDHWKNKVSGKIDSRQLIVYNNFFWEEGEGEINKQTKKKNQKFKLSFGQINCTFSCIRSAHYAFKFSQRLGEWHSWLVWRNRRALFEATIDIDLEAIGDAIDSGTDTVATAAASAIIRTVSYVGTRLLPMGTSRYHCSCTWGHLKYDEKKDEHFYLKSRVPII